jgi:hypothetical protein
MKPLDEKALEALEKMRAEMLAEGVNGWPNTVQGVIEHLRAALDPASGWMPLPAPDLERVIVAGWQKSKTTTAGGWWWYYEDFTDEKGVPTEHPDALLWVRLQGTLPALPAAPMSQES